MIAIYTSTSMSTVILFSVLVGIGMGTVIPSYYTLMGHLAPKHLVTFSMALIVTAQGIGQFIQPFLYEAILGALNQNIGRFPMLLSFIGLVFMSVLVIGLEYFFNISAPSNHAVDKTMINEAV